MTSPTQTTTVNVLRPYQYGRGYPTLNKTLNATGSPGSVLKVPGNRNFRLTSVTGIFNTSAVVATRTLTFQLLDGDSVVYARFPVHDTVAASGSTPFQFSPVISSSYLGGDGTRLGPAPDLFVPAGHQLQVTAINIDAGDTFASMSWYYDEYVIGGGGYRQGRADEPLPEVGP